MASRRHAWVAQRFSPGIPSQFSMAFEGVETVFKSNVSHRPMAVFPEKTVSHSSDGGDQEK
jgi:hypothetical protein